MGQEYTVAAWAPWIDKSTDDVIRDEHGNYKGSVTFVERGNEQVDATFKVQPQSGDKKYGNVEVYQTRAGKERLRFRRADRPVEGSQTGYAGSPTKDYDEIKAQVSLKVAATLWQGREWTLSKVEMTAVELYEMIGRIKTKRKFEPTPNDEPGYDKAKIVRQTIARTFNNGEPLPEEQPINLEEIPY
jgi:hypothetical protein